MFWGLIMKPNKCYTKTAKKGSIHVSMAALDIANATDEPTQVFCVFKGRNYLLCTLNKKKKLQCFLDLNFEAGSQVKFTTIGSSHVHLTGYVRVQGVQGGQDKFDKAQKEEKEIEEVSKKDKKRLKKELLEGLPKKKSKVVINSFSEEGDETSDTDIDKEEEEAGSEEGEEEENEDKEEQEEASSLSEDDEENKPKPTGFTKSPKQKNKEQEKISKEKNKKEVKKEQQKQPKKAVPKGGVIVQELKEGTREPIKMSGKFTTVYCEEIKENNELIVFTKRNSFVFRVINCEVMEGWYTRLEGMKVGGKRRMTCPPNIVVDVKLQEIEIRKIR